MPHRRTLCATFRIHWALRVMESLPEEARRPEITTRDLWIGQCLFTDATNQFRIGWRHDLFTVPGRLAGLSDHQSENFP